MLRYALALAALPLATMVAQAQVSIQDVRFAYGMFGPERMSRVYYPDDQVVVRFNVTGLKPNAEQHVAFEILAELQDPSGTQTKVGTQEGGWHLISSSNSVPLQLAVNIPSFPSPGEYTLCLTVKDKNGLGTAELQRVFTVRPPELAVVAPAFFSDEECMTPSPAVGVVGQILHLRATAIGLDSTQNRIALECHIQVLDARGEKVLFSGPKETGYLDDPDRLRVTTSVRLRTNVPLNCAGQFMVRYVLCDRLTGKTASVDIPLRVVDP